MVNDTTSDKELFDILSKMTNQLKDGHVNVFTPFGTSSYKFLNSRAPTINWLGESSIFKYGENIKTPNQTLVYAKIKNANIGYVWVKTFANTIADYTYIDNILSEYETADGFIIDLRMNGGGSDRNSSEIARRFTDEKRLYRKYRFRNGPGHNDFSDWNDTYLNPAGIQFLKTTIVLINENCYSATEDCLMALKELPNVTIIGDTTGGGLGNPMQRELPNGWLYRFSNWQEVDAQMNNFEDIGIAPDTVVWISRRDSLRGIDRILEAGIKKIGRK